ASQRRTWHSAVERPRGGCEAERRGRLAGYRQRLRREADARFKVLEDGRQFFGIGARGLIAREAVVPETDDVTDTADLLAKVEEHVRRAQEKISEGLRVSVGNKLGIGVVVCLEASTDVVSGLLHRLDDPALGVIDVLAEFGRRHRCRPNVSY